MRTDLDAAVTQDRAPFGGGWRGGFLCAYHGSSIDYAGRACAGPADLVVAAHQVPGDTRILTGADEESA